MVHRKAYSLMQHHAEDIDGTGFRLAKHQHVRTRGHSTDNTVTLMLHSSPTFDVEWIGTFLQI